MLKRLFAIDSYVSEAVAITMVMGLMAMMIMLLSGLAMMNLLYFEVGSFRWISGLLGVCFTPVAAGVWFLTQERDTFYSGRAMGAWAIGIAMGGLGVAVRSFFNF